MHASSLHAMCAGKKHASACFHYSNKCVRSLLDVAQTGWRVVVVLTAVAASICCCCRPTDMRSDVQAIFKLTPHDKQVMMFSATLAKDIRVVCKKFMNKVRPAWGDEAEALANPRLAAITAAAAAACATLLSAAAVTVALCQQQYRPHMQCVA